MCCWHRRGGCHRTFHLYLGALQDRFKLAKAASTRTLHKNYPSPLDSDWNTIRVEATMRENKTILGNYYHGCKIGKYIQSRVPEAKVLATTRCMRSVKIKAMQCSILLSAFLLLSCSFPCVWILLTFCFCASSLR